MHVDGPGNCYLWGGFRQKSGGDSGILTSPQHFGRSMFKGMRKFVELERVIEFVDWVRLPDVNAGSHIKTQIFFTCLDKPTLRPAGNGNHSRYSEARSAFSVSR